MDTGTLAEVPEDRRLDTDEGAGSNALVDERHPGPDDGLEDVYANPGELVRFGGAS